MTDEKNAEISDGETAADENNSENLTWKDLVSRLTAHFVLSLSRVYYEINYSFLQGIVDSLCQACEDLKWKAPTKIQREAIPLTIQGNFSINVFKKYQ